MEQERVFGVPMDHMFIRESMMEELFMDDDVSEAYSSFKRDGYVRKLKAVVGTIVVSDNLEAKNDVSSDTAIVSFIIKHTVEHMLFMQTDGDMKKALVLMMNDGAWREEIDEKYHFLVMMESLSNIDSSTLFS